MLPFSTLYIEGLLNTRIRPGSLFFAQPFYKLVVSIASNHHYHHVIRARDNDAIGRIRVVSLLYANVIFVIIMIVYLEVQHVLTALFGQLSRGQNMYIYSVIYTLCLG